MVRKSYRTETVSMYLTAAELAKNGFTVAVTSRNAQGVDLLARGPKGKVVGIQTKGNGRPDSWWVTGQKVASERALFFVFVNLRGEERPEFYVVPSRVVARSIRSHGRKGEWYGWDRDERWREKWRILEG